MLCCDLDTIFFTDVEVLFDRYAGPDVVAREEVYSGRSIHGADRAFIDEPLLEHLAHHLGRAVVPPINLGVVLYNHGVVGRLAAIMSTFVDDAWRPDDRPDVREFPNSDVAGNATFPWMADVRRHASDADRQRALPFPSNNGWIVDEVAWWLALGSIPGLTRADFAARDVAQNGEVLGDAARPSPVGAVPLLLAQPRRVSSSGCTPALRTRPGLPRSRPFTAVRRMPSTVLER